MKAHEVKEHEAADSKTLFGFWTYLMTDCILFATLFATFLVLRDNTFGGPSAKDLFDMPFVLTETMILLISSFVCGLGLLAAYRKRLKLTVIFFGITFLLGLAFLGMELYEFNHLHHNGNGWERSAFLSSFFTLVGTHGLHITAGLIWIAVMIFKIVKHGLTRGNVRRLALLSMFWHFLDVVWIFIFTIVYLMGAV